MSTSVATPAGLSCTVRRQLGATGTNSATVACNANETRTGGGCTSVGDGYRWKSFPVV